jgi:anti-sigma regulatory factor (Ser/Thr protein kinase)
VTDRESTTSPRGPLRLRWSFDIRDPAAASRARRSFLVALRSEGAEGDSYEAAEIIFGELISNAARYAPGTVDVTLEWSAEHPVLHIVDRGPGFRADPCLPGDPLAECGRGLFIVAKLGAEFGVELRPDGTHVRVRLPVARRKRSASN